MQPLALIQHDEGLEIVWDDLTGILPHQFLRVKCTCPVCLQERKNEIRSAVPSDIRLLGFTSVGDEGLCLLFSDGHIQGMYPWTQLRQLTEMQSTRYSINFKEFA